MADVHSKEVRSYNMSRIRSKDTKPELLVRKFLFSKGFRYRLHGNKLPGKPDIVLPKYKTVIFINGCFWHGHDDCKYATVPKTNIAWWREKISKNKTRDFATINALINEKWSIITIFTCELKAKTINDTLLHLVTSIKNKAP